MHTHSIGAMPADSIVQTQNNSQFPGISNYKNRNIFFPGGAA
jgi:hypothetical protein